MVMSSVETSTPKYVRLWSLKERGKGRRVDQGNRGKKDLERCGLRREDAYDQEKFRDSKLKQKLSTLASRDTSINHGQWDNGIKTDVAVVVSFSFNV